MRRKSTQKLLALFFVTACGGLMTASGCQSTQFFNEGPGQPTDRARGSVPAGTLGVCRRPYTRRPPIVNEKLWENTKYCTSRTPDNYVRLGYGHKKYKPDAVRKVDKMMEALREGSNEDSGNGRMLEMLSLVRERGAKDPWLRDRISKDSARTSTCDFTYMLNTMEKEHEKLRRGDRCAAHAYDPKQKAEVCLFDTASEEAMWLTSAWACVARTGEVGKQESCFRLCAYDDYCARQVSCVSPDLDLVLCAMGVCLPEKKDGIFRTG